MIITHNSTCRLALILSLALSSSIICTVSQAAPVKKKPVTISKPAGTIDPSRTISPSKIDILRPGGGINTAPGDFSDKAFAEAPKFGEGSGGFVNFNKPAAGDIQSNPAINQQKPSAAGTLNQIQKR
jgi:hypothetical protein